MSAWATLRTFHLGREIIYKDKVISAKASYALKQNPKGNTYWQAFWRENGKLNSVHLGKALPFDEPEPLPTIKELMLTVSKLEKENQMLRQRIGELDKGAVVTPERQSEPVQVSNSNLDFPSIHLGTYADVKGVLRAESAILSVISGFKIMEIHYYPDRTFAIHCRPGKRLWKQIELDEARKVYKKWQKDGVQFKFEKSKTPELVVSDRIDANVTIDDVFGLLRPIGKPRNCL